MDLFLSKECAITAQWASQLCTLTDTMTLVVAGTECPIRLMEDVPLGRSELKTTLCLLRGYSGGQPVTSGAWGLGQTRCEEIYTCMCRYCPKGKYSDQESQTQCKTCVVGKYQDQIGQSVCKGVPGGCAAGQYGPHGEGAQLPFANAELCVNCPAGKYQPNALRVACVDCEGGRFSNASGSTDCLGTICPKGTRGSLPNLGTLTTAHTCVDCQGNTTPTTTGTYQDQAGQVTCKVCPASKFQNQNRQEGCLGQGCPPGRYNANSTCAACPAGKYSFTSSSDRCCTQFASSGECAIDQLCAAGFFGVEGATRQEDASCTACPGGKFQALEGKPQCEGTACSGVNEYSPPGAKSSAEAVCRACPFGKFNNASVPGGYDPSRCVGVGCPKGKFSTGTTCTQCAPGQHTSQPGLPSCSGELCAAGRFADPGQSEAVVCKKCPSGKHQALTGKSTCAGASCAAGKFGSTGQVSQKPCNDCVAGQFSNISMIQSGKDSCEACPVGKYQSLTAQSGCVVCESGKFQDEVGKTECKSLACVAGYFGPLGSSAVISNRCQACPSGKYSSAPGSGTCAGSSCAAGRYGFSGSQNQVFATCFDCPAGKHSATSGANACTGTVCQPGTYGIKAAANASTAQCKNCPFGKYQGASEATECGQCATGTSTPITNAISVSQCTPCDAGRFSGLGTACLPCLPGQYGTATGQTSCLQCPAGKYQLSNSQTACLACPPGKHSNSTGANVACFGTSCTPGKYHAAGQTQEHVCKGANLVNIRATVDKRCALATPANRNVWHNRKHSSRALYRLSQRQVH